MSDQGLVLLFTGNGKGKTTAALGQSLRAAGQGMRVCIIQFIKGAWETGEEKALRAFGDQIELHTTGSGFTWQADDKEEVRQTALQGWQLATEKIMGDQFDLVVLEELTYLVTYGILKEAAIIDLLARRPPRQHVLITGRNASAGLVEVADLVTEMREIKHPFQNGRPAHRGIEY
jgi:cob(I)alamin adenosyltransferase